MSTRFEELGAVNGLKRRPPMTEMPVTYPMMASCRE